MTRTCKALIIGCGIAGTAVATFLRRAGLDVEIFEAWPRPTTIGGGLQVAPSGMHVLAELGLADEVRDAGVIACSMRFYSQSGNIIGTINRNMEEKFGQPAVNIRRSALQNILLSQARWHAADVSFGKKLVAIDDRPDRPLVAHFEDGTSAEGDLLIGADGVHSTVRNVLLPQGPKPFDIGLVGFGGFAPRGVLETTGVGSELRLTFGRSGSFGYGYVGPDPALGAMWWSTQPATGIDAPTYRAMGQSALKQHLLAFHDGWHQPIAQILEAAENIIVTATLDIESLPRWWRGRAVLIGDAAHATSPHAGLGASLALEDACRLAKALESCSDLEAAFTSFESERRPRAERVVAIARQNGNSKRAFSPAGEFFRNQMMRLMLPLFAGGRDWMYDYDARAA